MAEVQRGMMARVKQLPRPVYRVLGGPCGLHEGWRCPESGRLLTCRRGTTLSVEIVEGWSDEDIAAFVQPYRRSLMADGDLLQRAERADRGAKPTSHRFITDMPSDPQIRAVMQREAQAGRAAEDLVYASRHRGPAWFDDRVRH